MHYNFDTEQMVALNPDNATMEEILPFVPAQEQTRVKFKARISLGQTVANAFRDTLLEFTHQKAINEYPI